MSELFDMPLPKVNVIHGCAGDICDVCAYYRKNPAITSVKAAESLNVGQLEDLIYNAIKSAGDRGMIADELLAMFPTLSYSSVTARPASLKRKGLVKDSGYMRNGRSGRAQSVLVAVH